ncbi:MAG: hypothetical protein II388_05140 [Clostridia bacterium]|nr:hypothetical protein [Clostridia bacterium]
MLKITEGTVNRALKVVIYGSEGISIHTNSDIFAIIRQRFRPRQISNNG